MSKLLKAFTARKFVLFILVFLIATDLSILLDIPFFRQFLGFLFFAIVPGLLILYILKLDNLGLTEKIVLSVSLSLSFSMFAGLLINSVYPLFGYASPLSTISVVISFSIILLILTIVAYLRNRTASFAKLSDFKLSTREKVFLFLPTFFPLLGIFGMHIMNTIDNNIMLMVLLLLIPAYVIFISVKHNRVPDRVYPVIIFVCGLSLLLIWALRSNHIVIGADTEQEYYLFNLVADGHQWQIFGGEGPLSACLSISLLPAIFQSFCGMSLEITFRIFYPLVLSMLPLIVYVISKKYAGSFYAFIASFLFISFYCFWQSNFRVNIGVLFFALTIMVLFHNKINSFNRNLLFIIFAASCIMSHYSVTYIFFLLLLLMWIGMQALKRFGFYRRRVIALSKDSVPRLSVTMLVLFLAYVFFWYAQVTTASFGAGVSFMHGALVNLHEFFVLESSTTIVQYASGTVSYYGGTPATIELISSWLVILFIAIGVLAMTIRYIKGNVSAFSSDPGSKQPGSPPAKMDSDYLLLGLGGSAIMVFSVVVPWISHQYDLFRTYFQMMALLSVFFVFGGITISKYIKVRPYYLLLIVLVPYFMCTTSTMYQVFDMPRSIVLNSEGNQYDDIFTHDQECYSADWLGTRAVIDNSNKVYTDVMGWPKVITYGLISREYVDNKSFPALEEKGGGYIYLRYYNVVNAKIIKGGKRLDIAEYQDKFVGRNKIYSNGGSEIWR